MPKIARTFTTLHTQLHTSCRPKIPQSVACPTSTEIGQQIALPETDKSPVKMNGWKMRFPFDLLDLLGWPIFRGYWQNGAILVSGRVLDKKKEQKYEILKDPST